MKQNKRQFYFLALAFVASLALVACPSPTGNDTTGGGDSGGDTGPTPVIFTDFETDLGGWAGNNATAELTSEQVKNGAQACKVITGDAGWKTAWMYSVGDKIANDVSYDYSVWVYQETGSEVQFNITIKTSNEQYKSAVYQTAVPSGAWTEITGTLTIAATDGTASDIYIESGTESVTFYFDDFKVIQTP